MSVSRELLRRRRLAYQWSSAARARSVAGASAGRKTASAIHLEGTGDTRMRSDNPLDAWLQTTTGIVVVLLASSVFDWSFAGVLLRAFCRSCLHDGVVHRESRVVRFVDSLAASLRITVAHSLCFHSCDSAVSGPCLRCKQDSVDRSDFAPWACDGGGRHRLFTAVGCARVFQYARG